MISLGAFQEMKHQTGDWLAKWYCGNILHFHSRLPKKHWV